MHLYTAPPGSLPEFPEGQAIIYPHFCRGDVRQFDVYVNVLSGATARPWTLFGGRRSIADAVQSATARWLTMEDGLDFHATTVTTTASESMANTRDGVSDVLGTVELPTKAYGQASAYCSPRLDYPCRSLECTITVYTENKAGPIKYTTVRSGTPTDTVNLESIVVHEFGHVVGLADTIIVPDYVMGYWPLAGDDPINPNYDEYVVGLLIYGPR